MIEAFVKDPEEQDKLFHAVENFPAIKKKADYAINWTKSSRSFAERLIGCVPYSAWTFTMCCTTAPSEVEASVADCF